MIIAPPDIQEMQTLLGKSLFTTWQKIVEEVEARYSLEKVWHTAGKKWQCELKFRKGSKTICSLLAKQELFGFMVIFGRQEQEQFEVRRGDFSPMVVTTYDEAITYRDGKWILFDAHQEELLADFMNLLLIKRTPVIALPIGHRKCKGNA